MDDIPALVEKFFSASGKGKATADKFRPLLPISIGFLQSLGLELYDIPTEQNLKLLEQHLLTLKNKLGKNYSESTIHDWIRITKDFFSYTHNSKGDILMTIQDNETKGINPIYTPDTENEGNTDTETEGGNPIDTLDAEHEKRKPGRPTKGDEGRDKKITVNIPTSIFLDIKDMANIDNVTFPDCVNYILENAVNDRWDDIQAIRALRARRH